MSEIKKAARENSSNLRDILTSIRSSDVLPSCFKEALLEASRGGHLDAICSLIIIGRKHSLQLEQCISEALRFYFYEAAAMLLTCYAARHDKQRLLKYLMGVELSREVEEEAFSELPHRDGVPRDALDKMRYDRNCESSLLPQQLPRIDGSGMLFKTHFQITNLGTFTN